VNKKGQIGGESRTYEAWICLESVVECEEFLSHGVCHGGLSERGRGACSNFSHAFFGEQEVRACTGMAWKYVR